MYPDKRHKKSHTMETEMSFRMYLEGPKFKTFCSTSHFSLLGNKFNASLEKGEIV